MEFNCTEKILLYEYDVKIDWDFVFGWRCAREHDQFTTLNR